MIEIGRTFGARDGILRLRYELRRGSGLMSQQMQSVAGWDHWKLERLAPGSQAEEVLSSRRGATNRFFFADARALGAHLRQILGIEGQQLLIRQAEGILAGKLPYFGRLAYECGFPPRWFRNPVTGVEISPQQPWTKLRFASKEYGDLKYILEPSRFLFSYALARAYAISGDEKFAEAFWVAAEDWARNSPPMTGPLWICGQECSLRIVAWSFALHAFLHAAATTKERASLLLSMIAAHAWRTSVSLDYARSQRSNHLISEAVGLWTTGTLYPELKEAAQWQKLGSDLLREAVMDQITPEGVSQQYSFNYQRMILQSLLWTIRLAEICEVELDAAIRSRTERAFEFIRALVDPVSGEAPNHGSNDGSLILPLSECAYPDYRPLLQMGAAVLRQPGLPTGPWDEAPLWLGGSPSKPERKPARNPAETTGYFRLGDDESWAMVRAGRYTRRPFQADQLHVDLWWRGLNIARDAGTYLYNGEPPWDNGLARTAAHNTITMDGRDQMRRAGRFLWLDWAQASGAVSCNDGVQVFTGQHDGYKRIGVMHQRRVYRLPVIGWIVLDDVLGSGEHDLQLHWLTGDWPRGHSSTPSEIRFETGQGPISWNLFSATDGHPSLVRAGMSNDFASAQEELALLGRDSPTYGELQPAVSLLFRVRGALPIRFTTLLLTDLTCRAEEISGQVVLKREQSQICGISSHPCGEVAVAPAIFQKELSKVL